MQVQCNVFQGATSEVALTAAGGLRKLPGLTEYYEDAALVHPSISSFSNKMKKVDVFCISFHYVDLFLPSFFALTEIKLSNGVLI